jgi:hypothetical protein
MVPYTEAGLRSAVCGLRLRLVPVSKQCAMKDSSTSSSGENRKRMAGKQVFFRVLPVRNTNTPVSCEVNSIDSPSAGTTVLAMILDHPQERRRRRKNLRFPLLA